MSRSHSSLSLEILNKLLLKPSQDLATLAGTTSGTGRKKFYDAIFRLSTQGLIIKSEATGKLVLTGAGHKLLALKNPQRDGVWKLLIFDIPERQRSVRAHLRAKLKQLGFKKWQASIWVSPYAIDPEVETELGQLAQKYFIRLIRTTEINHTVDLEDLFRQ